MGVPKFYRWISERYPCLSETVKEFQIPEFDNLYLDMNGIIHVCSHPDDGNPHFRITEEKIFTDIFHYLEFLFRIIKPQKVFFMAVDGVAPRAKMNQQRGRRFRSAREAEELEKKARELGETLPTEKRFDSNCITPGTPFMVRLQEQLKYFVVSKQSTDPLWNGVQIHLSGHETPGEGEHKIMDYIRYERSQPNYNPNTRHCLYGLDADLMMLGLATHEPHFSLLREEVRFGGHKDKNKRPATPEETTFHLLHLSLFREYLDFEFSPLKSIDLGFPYDLERIIDDWVLMGFLVGNDFIPHLPHLHIQHDALPLLWKTYMKVLPSCGGYLHNGGTLNLERFEKFMEALAEFDIEKFSDTYTDLKWLEGKIGGKAINEEAAQAANEKSKRKLKKFSSNQFEVLMEDDDDIGDEFVSTDSAVTGYHMQDAEEEEEEGDTFDEEFRQHKKYYYMSKMEYEKVTPAVLQDQAECYARGIQWILFYYYDGVPSWSWYYPYHYAPYISDVKNFKHKKIEFELSQPFLPFQQLMAVLPSLSKELLPLPYQSLMTMDNSPVIDFYPINFQTDLNGKQQDWEAVVLIPFIDEKRLLAAMDQVESQLTAEERSRNIHGPSFCFEYTEMLQVPYPSSLPGALPDIAASHSIITKIDMNMFRISTDLLIKGILDNVLMDVYFPGFPTLKHLPHKAKLKKEGVKVFQMNSRSENMILQILPPEKEPDLKFVADNWLGKCVFVSWPHLYEAKVLSVSDRETRYVHYEQTTKGGKTHKVLTEQQSAQEGDIWGREVHAIKDRYHDRLGIDVGDTHILLKAVPMVGRKYICGSHGKITLEKEFSTHPVSYLLQASVKDITTHDSSFCQFKTLTELFPPKETVFMMGWPHYGCQGEVVDTEEGQSPRVRINVSIPVEPQLVNVENDQQYHEQRFYPGHQIARMCGISSHFLSRITGSIMIRKGSPDRPVENGGMINIGLNLKFTKRSEETPGFTKLYKEGGWGYSMKAMEVVSSYLKQFPGIWDVICSKGSDQSDLFYESELFPENGGTNIKAMQDFMKTLPCNGVKTMKAGADVLDEGVVVAIEEEVQSLAEINKKKQKRVKMQVKPHLLYRPIIGQGNMVPDPTVTFNLYDRVVNIRQGFPVPFGLRGTVIGIHEAEKEMDTMHDILFDEEFQGGIKLRCSTNRAYRMPKSSVVNLSHGERKNGAKLKPASQQPNDNRNQSQSYRGRHGPGFPYAAASQNNSEGYANRNNNSNRYNSYHNDNRNIVKDQKHYQNTWTDQRQEGRMDNRKPWMERTENKQSSTQERRKSQTQQQDSSRLDVNSQSFDEGRNAVSPKFVMPKVSNKSTPKQGVKGQSAQGKTESQNPEFAQIWQELSSVKTMTSGDSESGQGTSLSAAAAALGKLPTGLLPTPVQNDTKKKPEEKLTVENLFNQANKVQLTADSEQFSAMMKSLDLSQEKTEDGAIVVTKKPVSPKVEAGEGTAALKQMLHIGSPEEAESVKQEEETATVVPPTGRTYGKQLSVQELFDVAKQPQTKIDQKALPQQEENVPDLHQNLQKSSLPPGPPPPLYQQHPQQPPYHPPASAVPHYPPPLQLAPLLPFSQVPPPGNYRHQKPRYANQQQVYVQQVRGHPSQVRGHQQMVQPQLQGNLGARNPVMELLEWCKATRNGEPKYDFFGKPGSTTCVVTLSSGIRFQGSTTRTKEAAAESAAAMALLNLGIQPHQRMPPMGFPPVPQVVVPPPQISSPNSAFKPVSPKDYSPQKPNIRQHQQQHAPNNSTPGGYPGNNSQRGQHHQSSQDRYYRQGTNQHQDNRQNSHQGKEIYNQSWKKQHHHSANQKSNDIANEHKVENSDHVGVKANPFVPMQVTRQQRTPGRRKESESLSDSDNKNSIDSTDVSPKSDSNDTSHLQPASKVARDLFGQQQNAKLQVKSEQKHDQQETQLLIDFSEPKQTCEKIPSNPKQSTTPGQGGKRKSRLAANLNFGGSS